VDGKFSMEEATLKIIHLVSIGLCAPQRTRWFSGILPIYPLVARVYLDMIQMAASGTLREIDTVVVWCATNAWLNVLFGKNAKIISALKSPRDLCNMLIGAAKSGFTLDMLFNERQSLLLNGSNSHYKHCKIRVFPLYEHAEGRDDPLLVSLHAIECSMCVSCQATNTKCPESKRVPPAPSFFSFALVAGCGQEFGSPINPQPTTETSMMFLLPNKTTKRDTDLQCNFNAAFSTALYPYLARFEILPPSWSMNI
jgi:hypothetical protein